jgi:hypothetical protein
MMQPRSLLIDPVLVAKTTTMEKLPRVLNVYLQKNDVAEIIAKTRNEDKERRTAFM